MFLEPLSRSAEYTQKIGEKIPYGKILSIGVVTAFLGIMAQNIDKSGDARFEEWKQSSIFLGFPQERVIEVRRSFDGTEAIVTIAGNNGIPLNYRCPLGFPGERISCKKPTIAN